jgi:hypothetical protein
MSLRAMLANQQCKAAFRGIGQWLGEAVIGLIPWAGYVVIHQYGTLPVTATCPKQNPNPFAPNLLQNCTPLLDSPSQEICILAVVISGLAVLSVVPMGRGQQRKSTVLTRLLVLAALLSLMGGSLFYTLFAGHLDKSADIITYYILATALLSSFFLAIEGEILAIPAASGA